MYTLKEWDKRFRHYTKRIYNVDVKQLLTDDTVATGDPGTRKNQKSDMISSGVQDRQQ